MKTVYDIISGKQALPGNDTWDEMENFLGNDWSLSYNLYNPENFQDPDNAPAWYDPNDSYEYYETPFLNPRLIEIGGTHSPENLLLLKRICEHVNEIESSIITYLVNYTFHDGGAYAAGKHFYFAKKTIEKKEKKVFKNEEDFMKHCISVKYITLGENGSDWILGLRCAWDTEHGLEIYFDNTSLVARN